MHVVTSEFQKFTSFPECSLGCLAAMDYFPVLLTVGFDDESHFFFLRFFFKTSA